MQSRERVDDVVVFVQSAVAGEAEDFAFDFCGDGRALGQADLSAVPGGYCALRPGELVAHGPFSTKPDTVILSEEVRDAAFLPADEREWGRYGLQVLRPHGRF